MSYNLNLNKAAKPVGKVGTATVLRQLLQLMGEERRNLFIAMIFIFINVGLNLLGPYLMGHAVDNFVVTKHYDGVIRTSIILFCIFLLAMLAVRFRISPVFR